MCLAGGLAADKLKIETSANNRNDRSFFIDKMAIK
jgi:hypothetical protein